LLEERRYLTGDKMTEADWRLFTTLLRFDSVYYTHFKCNLRRIEEYPHLSNYLRDLYQHPGIKETVNFKHIKEHYFKSHKTINPTGIVPKGPELDLSTQHNRSQSRK
jgi:putative glutathione S-transferase